MRWFRYLTQRQWELREFPVCYPLYVLPGDRITVDGVGTVVIDRPTCFANAKAIEFFIQGDFS